MTPNPDDRRVFLGQPGYGELTAGSARGFWRASRLPDSSVWRQYNEGSLLANNFNQLWCAALNLAHQGRRVDYFAMIHADIEPEDWWLDKLIDELEARDLDMLGVVVPIKDRRGITSVALDRPDGDTWRPLCRLTMAEVFRLPETFTSEDVGHPLLLNTGLWVCRFAEDWARQVHFTINDRIAFDTGKDRYVAVNESEDWFFSRLCHEMGKKVGATRKIRLMHRGPTQFSNDHVWGEPFDSASVESSVLPAPDLGAFVLPDIDGWLRPAEGAKLAELAAGKRVLEIGSYFGLSTVCLARTAAHVTAIDPHDGRGTHVPQSTIGRMKLNLARYGVSAKVQIRQATAAEAHASMNGDAFDLIFIDGAHDRESVAADIDIARQRLAPGGLIAFHDYRSDADPGATAAIDDLLQSGGELVSLVESLAVVRPPSLVPITSEV
jgi:SAM-dependent methyltransferase